MATNKYLSENSSQKEISTSLDDITSDYPNILGDIAYNFDQNNSYKDSSISKSACFFTDKFKKYSDLKFKKDMATEVGLMALPFATYKEFIMID